MSAAFLVILPGLPLLVALLIGGLHFAGFVKGESGEKITARLAVGAASLCSLLALTLLAGLSGQPTSQSFGNWLQSGELSVELLLDGSGLRLWLATLFALLQLVATRFSVNYLHREAGFQRFFFVLSLFAAAMQLLVLAGNALFTFMGWELAGLCSYLLIGYAYERPLATQNAVRVFVTNRIGDAGFLLGIGLALLWLGSCDWQVINAAAGLQPVQISALASCFVVAACAKSAQLPFSPWLARAMEGPTPSSAVFYGGVMIHAGVFLLIQLQGLLQQAPLMMAALVVIGLLTAIYSYWIGLSQTDIKSSHAFATTLQLGLMLVECGLDCWTLASWHLACHAVLRCYLLLTSPSLLFNTQGRPMPTVPAFLVNHRLAFMLSLQRFWLEPACDWLLIKPVKQLARDAEYLEHQVIEPALGVPAPAINAISSLAQWEERRMGANLDSSEDNFAQGSGLAGKLAQWTAGMSHWFETHFILQGIGRHSISWGRQLGHVANRFEQLMLQPRYLTLFVVIVLLVALND